MPAATHSPTPPSGARQQNIAHAARGKLRHPRTLPYRRRAETISRLGPRVNNAGSDLLSHAAERSEATEHSPRSAWETASPANAAVQTKGRDNFSSRPA